MDNHMIEASELILNPDGSVYHLDLKPDEVAKTIITVGDPDRVDMVSRYLDEQYLVKQKREFKTVTGRIGNRDISIISTGIGTDNIDIVFNELDALFNIDLKNRIIKKDLTSLNFIRLGTSGCMQRDIPVDSFLVSAMALETEGLLVNYGYAQTQQEEKLSESVGRILKNIQFQSISCHREWLNKLPDTYYKGISYTAGGFYAPQGRSLRIKSQISPKMIKAISEIQYNNLSITNFEMETAGIYGLSKMFGHKAISFNALLANRVRREFSKSPNTTVSNMVEDVLGRLDDLV